ncbi:MAG: MFS transporter [Eubacteriales bacterium]
MATLLLIIIYLAFISLGLPDSMLGAIWPAAYAELGVPVSFAGIASVVVTSGTVISSLLSVRVIRRFGTGRVTAVCVLLTASALLGISFTGSFAAILLLALPLGLGGGAIDAALNNYVALHYKASHMSFLHGFWGVGASISPLIVSYYLMQNGNWHGGFRTVSIIQFSLALVMIATLPFWAKVSHAKPDELIGEPVVVSNRAALKRRGAIYSVLSFFFYCAAEASVGSGRRPISSACAELSPASPRMGFDVLHRHHGRAHGHRRSCDARQGARAHLLGLVTAAMGALPLHCHCRKGSPSRGCCSSASGARRSSPTCCISRPSALARDTRRRSSDCRWRPLISAAQSCRRSSAGSARPQGLAGFPIICWLASPRCTRASSSATAGRDTAGRRRRRHNKKRHQTARQKPRCFFTITPRAIQTFVRYNGERSFSAATNTGVAPFAFL